MKELFSQVQLSKETGISRSTIRDYIRDYAEFLEVQTGFKNGFKAYNNTAKEILIHIKDMHQRGLTINLIKELLAEKYPMQISDTVSREPNISKIALRDKVPQGLVSKQEYDELFARVTTMMERIEQLEKIESRVTELEKENAELKHKQSTIASDLTETNIALEAVQDNSLKETRNLKIQLKEHKDWTTVRIEELETKSNQNLFKRIKGFFGIK
ncbi:hypothetical protein JCM14036_02840 [Desulfotomaculum defluvii]